MNIQGYGPASATYSAMQKTQGKASPASTASPAGTQASSTQVTLSDQAKAMTAQAIDAQQKAGGFVNTMSKLSPSEKKLYDELVAQGNTEAVRGMNMLALSRMDSGDVTLPNGQTFDPAKTDITPDNIRNLFSRMFVSNDGQDARSFEALASYLDSKKAA